MSTSITIYAYVGVEIIAASALEASGTEPGRSVSRRASATVGGRCESQPDAAELVGQRVRFSAIYFPLLAAGAYTISSILASLLIPQSHCSLPHLSWVDPVKCQDGDGVMHTSSMFVIIADEAEIPGLSHIFNGIIVFTALTCANTNLYVASRCLFGLTTRLEGGGRQPPHIRILAVFGKTNKRGVPVNAVIVSALAFCWVPFMQLIRASPIDVVRIANKSWRPSIRCTVLTSHFTRSSKFLVRWALWELLLSGHAIAWLILGFVTGEDAPIVSSLHVVNGRIH